MQFYLVGRSLCIGQRNSMTFYHQGEKTHRTQFMPSLSHIESMSLL